MANEVETGWLKRVKFTKLFWAVMAAICLLLEFVAAVVLASLIEVVANSGGQKLVDIEQVVVNMASTMPIMLDLMAVLVLVVALAFVHVITKEKHKGLERLLYWLSIVLASLAVLMLFAILWAFFSTDDLTTIVLLLLMFLITFGAALYLSAVRSGDETGAEFKNAGISCITVLSLIVSVISVIGTPNLC